MSAKRKSARVRVGCAAVTVYPWTHPATGAERWRFGWKTEGKWKYRTFRTKAGAESAAERTLENLGSATIRLDDLPDGRHRFLSEVHRMTADGNEDRVLAFLRSMETSDELSGAVERFLSSMVAKAGEETPHLRTLGNLLRGMAAHFSGKTVVDVHADALGEWFKNRTAAAGWKRRRDIRANLVQFWRWCRRQGIAGNDGVTVAERLPEIGGRHGERRVFTVEEFRAVESAMPREFRAWWVLGCFFGLRPEEIAPPEKTRKLAKRGLHCEEIDWNFRVLRIAPEVAKTGLPRVVPFFDGAEEWLNWAGIRPGMTGPTTLRNAAEARVLASLAKRRFDGGWPRDICRHSFGSFRNAILRDLAKVAEEMGTSVSMLHRHYHNPRAEAEGQAWFSMRPAVPICSDESGVDRIAEEIAAERKV